MDEEELQSRLSRIATSWDLIRRAHVEDQDAAATRHRLMDRYCGAAYRYLLAALRDPDAADDMFQEFALRFARGDFRNADPGRGRFRQFLKTALINLVRDYRRKGRRASGRSLQDLAWAPAVPGSPDDADERQLLESWRNELLAQAWAALRSVENQTRRPYYTLLRLKAEEPDLSSAEMAARLTAQLRPEAPWSETALRKLLQRAREEFAELLVRQVHHSLEDPGLEELEAELVELGLHAYCRAALERRRR